MISERVRTLIREITIATVKNKGGSPTKFLNSQDLKQVSLRINNRVERSGWGVEGSFDDFKRYLSLPMAERFEKSGEQLGVSWDKMIIFRWNQFPERAIPVQYAAEGKSSINNQRFTIDAKTGGQFQIIIIRSGKTTVSADSVVYGSKTINDFQY
jgi:hypothetical protein